MKDAAIAEMHQIKDAIAAENKNDVRAIIAAVRKKHRVSAKRLVCPPRKKAVSA